MKMTKEHYDILKEGMQKALEDLKQKGINNKAEFVNYYIKNNIGINPKNRACFDLLRASKINNDNSTRFICDVLYKYLNDNHINTALNKIMNEI